MRIHGHRAAALVMDCPATTSTLTLCVAATTTSRAFCLSVRNRASRGSFWCSSHPIGGSLMPLSILSSHCHVLSSHCHVLSSHSILLSHLTALSYGQYNQCAAIPRCCHEAIQDAGYASMLPIIPAVQHEQPSAQSPVVQPHCPTSPAAPAPSGWVPLASLLALRQFWSGL